MRLGACRSSRREARLLGLRVHEHKGKNAAALLTLVEELRNSFRVELKLVQSVTAADVSDKESVVRLARFMRDYDQFRELDTERTHCRNIGRNTKELQRPYQTGNAQDSQLIEEMKRIADQLSHADDHFVDDLETLLAGSLQTVLAMEEAVVRSDFDAARTAQEEFAGRMEQRIKASKKVLKDINDLSNELIDLG